VSDARDLLAFAPPDAGPIPPVDGPTGFRPVHRPAGGRQGARVAPQFDALRDALDAERAQLAESTTAADPELVAVFDLVGSVDGFLRATAGVEGLEFLADLQEDYVEPDDDFYYEEDGARSEEGVPQSLYMIMANAAAVGELVRLFQLWQDDPGVTLSRGLAPLKEVFALLRSIRRWGPEDRVRESGLLEQWAEDVAVVGTQGFARVEVELWFRSGAEHRGTARDQVIAAVEAVGGQEIASAEIEAIAYQAVLADIPMAAVERVLRDGPEAIELLTTEAVMLVGPARQMALTRIEVSEEESISVDESPPSGRPRVALLDGAPLANHTALAGRLVIDDPDDHESRYTAAQRSHGTAMASLILYGDLSDPSSPPRQPIYLRPILVPHEHYTDVEVTPKDGLLVDLVLRSFRRVFEGDGDREPAAPSVRVVNLSIGDPARVFVRRLSPLARLLDLLAYQYNLVIVVSAGNHPEVHVSVPSDALSDAAELQKATARALHEQARLRRLLSPAEAVNVLTVGALHDDGYEEQLPDTVIDAGIAGAPAPYSPVGFGFRRSVKPELHVPGGRRVFRAPPDATTGDVELEFVDAAHAGPGLRVAAPGLAGELSATGYGCGTSYATALATRALNGTFDVLESLKPEDGEPTFPDAQYHPVLARALVVHAAGWHDLGSSFGDALDLSGASRRRELTQVLGYGPLHDERLVTSERTRVTLLGAGSIPNKQRHTFRFPLPPSLAASTEWRRLTITLAWLSPLNMRSQKYRMARLKFSPPLAEIGVAPTEADHHAVLKGTVQHQVLEGTEAVAYVDGAELAIEVDCRSDAGTMPGPVRYALVASLEVAATVKVDLHAEVRDRLRAQVRERDRAQVAAR
jgi:hypothetical protein